MTEGSFTRTAKRIADAPGQLLGTLGRQGIFYAGVAGSVPSTLRRYKREIVRLIAEYGMGTAALALVGGSAAVVGSINFFSGAVVAAQGFTSLTNVGVGSLAPVFAAFTTIRISVPLLCGIALAVTLGAATTSELGAMRISEEIDALEVMSVRPLRYLVTTRVLASLVVVTPLYVFSSLTGFLANYVFLVSFYDIGEGTFTHYFYLYLNPIDIILAYFQVIVMVVVLMAIHTYYGYSAGGGPAGVGDAVGRSVRASLSAVMIVGLLVALAEYGTFDTFHLAG